MAWDFSTEPEFEAKLVWMREFVREEVFPLETLDLTYDQIREVIQPMQERSRPRVYGRRTCPRRWAGWASARSAWA